MATRPVPREHYKILTPANPSSYTVEFRGDGRLTAKVDCNRGAGAWKSAGPGRLDFGPLALTRRLCLQAAPLSDRIARDWTHVRSYVIRNGHLFLSLMADGGVYEFEPMGPPLEDTDWRLVRLGDADVKASSPKRQPHLTLDGKTRRLSGSGGCNRFLGGYELHGDQLALSPAAGTRMACIDGMETEKTFLGALLRVKKWRVEGRRLELSDADGKLLARFEAGPAPASAPR